MNLLKRTSRKELPGKHLSEKNFPEINTRKEFLRKELSEKNHLERSSRKKILQKIPAREMKY
jgi:hypothetical protein